MNGYRRCGIMYTMDYYSAIKKNEINLFTKQKQTHRQRKQTYASQSGKGVGINWDFGLNRYTLLYIKQINKAYCIAQGAMFNIL